MNGNSLDMKIKDYMPIITIEVYVDIDYTFY